MERDHANETTELAELAAGIEGPTLSENPEAASLELAVHYARALAPSFAIGTEVRFCLEFLSRHGDTPTGIDDATLSQFVAHQPDAVALHMGLIAAEATRDAADDGSGIDQTSASYLIAARDAVYDLTKKLVATRLELEKATADQEELTALRRESAMLTALEAEALHDPIYLHNGTEEALLGRKTARGLGFGPAIGRTLRDAIAPFLESKGNR